MGPAEWDALPWDLQQMYWEGMIGEGLVEAKAPVGSVGEAPQITDRQAEGGADVIDIQAMIRDSQVAQARRDALG